MHEILVKRTIWVAQCPKCGDRAEKTEDAPRERRCMPCGEWVPYVEESYVGPSLDEKGKTR